MKVKNTSKESYFQMIFKKMIISLISKILSRNFYRILFDFISKSFQ